MLPVRPHRQAARARVADSRSDAAEAQRLLLPLVLAFVLALLMAWPSHIRAQASGATTTASSSGAHTVRAGETLWSLAARYYGDGHKWRELASTNGLAEGGERGIVVGQLLRVPAAGPSLAQARAAMAEAPPRATPREAVTPAATTRSPAEHPAAAADVPATERPASAEPATPSAPDAEVAAVAEPAAPAPLAAPERGTLMGEAPVETRGVVKLGLVRRVDLALARGSDNTTIFLGPEPFNADTMQGTIDLGTELSFVEPAGRRAGEFAAAPFAVSADVWKTTGRVGRRTHASSAKSSLPQRMQSRDLVEFVAPEGFDAIPGTQLLVIVPGAVLGSGIRLAMPIGVLTVEEPKAGVPQARISMMFDVVIEGQTLVPFVEAPAAPVAADVSLLETQVRWVADGQLLPSLRSYLVLTSQPGIEVGDRFELVSDMESHARVADVRVVRITEHGATAIIMHQDEPAVRTGLQARRVGRAP